MGSFIKKYPKQFALMVLLAHCFVIAGAYSIDFYVLTQFESGQISVFPDNQQNAVEIGDKNQDPAPLKLVIILLFFRISLFFGSQFFIGFAPSIYAIFFRDLLFQRIKNRGVVDVLKSNGWNDFLSRQTLLLGTGTVYFVKGFFDILLLIGLAWLLTKAANNTTILFSVYGISILLVYFYVKLTTSQAVKSNYYHEVLNQELLAFSQGYKSYEASGISPDVLNSVRLKALNYGAQNGFYFLIRSLPRFHAEASILLAAAFMAIYSTLPSDHPIKGQSGILIGLILLRGLPLVAQLSVTLAKVFSTVGPIKRFKGIAALDWTDEVEIDRLTKIAEDVHTQVGEFYKKKTGIASYVSHSGAGKSFFIECLSGLHGPVIKDYIFEYVHEKVLDPSEISIMVNDTDIRTVPAVMVNFFDEHVICNPLLSDLQLQIKSLSDLMKASGKDCSTNVVDNEIKHIDAHDININFSTGQSTLLRVLLCLNKPADFYVLDEPTIGLDSDGKAALFSVINKMSNNAKFLIISHDNEFLKYFGGA